MITLLQPIRYLSIVKWEVNGMFLICWCRIGIGCMLFNIWEIINIEIKFNSILANGGSIVEECIGLGIWSWRKSCWKFRKIWKLKFLSKICRLLEDMIWSKLSKNGQNFLDARHQFRNKRLILTKSKNSTNSATFSKNLSPPKKSSDFKNWKNTQFSKNLNKK